MDTDGFLPLDLISSFPRIRNLTIDLGFIIDSLRDSENVELSEDQQKVGIFGEIFKIF
jgi:la-related protein 1